ncbi:uncharacterized protein [Euwallacea fornicatus]|uniref:uncharacterized protein n=1 Tax=Euwallacea fornicatus TaxID=995702 RepID=UPI00338D6153
MNINTPRKKRRKPNVTEDSFYEVNAEICKVIQLKKYLGDLIDQTFDSSIVSSYLSNVHIEPQKQNLPRIPEVNEKLPREVNCLAKKYGVVASESKRQLQLLTVLEKKEQCPISNAIDQI